jgi:hypothetical protein
MQHALMNKKIVQTFVENSKGTDRFGDAGASTG